MKIQEQLSKKTKGKTYYKYVVVFPAKLLKKAGLKAGDEVKGEVKKSEIRLRKI